MPQRQSRQAHRATHVGEETTTTEEKASFRKTPERQGERGYVLA